MTDRERWARVEALFDAALDVPATERQEWLRAHCPDEAIRTEVAAMLRAHVSSDGILDAPAVPPATAGAPAGDLPTRLAKALGGRYAILNEIGRGGAGTVFLAEDRKHQRRVVLKVLNPGVAQACGPERFAREVQIAARLAHPHIVGLIDSGEADGLLYYVMPYVEGETLRTRLRRLGTLPVAQATTLLRDVADALRFAHGRKVVHRDLKPENILCVGDHAYLLDFGVAKLLGRGPEETEQLTNQGDPVGTLAYMAPEQLRGGPDVDHRADIYAWGLIAWEMLSGQLPPYDPGYAEGSAVVSGLRLDAPAGLERLIMAALEPDPRARLASAELLLDGLDRLPDPGTEGMPAPTRARSWGWVAAGAAFVAVLAAVLWPRAPAATPAAGDTSRVPQPVAVAVLVNETGDPALDTWGRMAGDWMTQGLQETGLVEMVPWPLARRASEPGEGGDAPGAMLARLREETGAATVITGSYYRVGDSLLFRAELVEAGTGRLLEALPAIATTVDSAAVAMRVLRDRVMGLVALRLDERLTPVPGGWRHPPTYAAYQLFDRGVSRFQAQEYRGALDDYRAAYGLDTSFVTALVNAAAAAYNVEQYELMDSLLTQAEERRERLSPSERARVDAGRAALNGDPEGMRLAMRRAIERVAGSPSLYNLAVVELSTDRPAEALAALDGLDPDRGTMRGWSSYWTQRTHALHLLGRHEEELVAARELRRRFPDRRVGLVLEVRALAAMGRTAGIDSVLAAAQSLPPTTYWSLGGAMVTAGEDLRAHGHGRAGVAYLERAVGWIEAQVAQNPDYEAHHYWLGSAWYGLGRWPGAAREFGWLSDRHPDRLGYRGMHALAEARRGRPQPASVLGTVPPRMEGDRLAYEARLAAVRGEPDRAVALLADAMQHGVDGLPWLHGTAWPDLILLAPVSAGLPASLRVAPGEMEGGAGGR